MCRTGIAAGPSPSPCASQRSCVGVGRADDGGTMGFRRGPVRGSPLGAKRRATCSRMGLSESEQLGPMRQRMAARDRWRRLHNGNPRCMCLRFGSGHREPFASAETVRRDEVSLTALTPCVTLPSKQKPRRFSPGAPHGSYPGCRERSRTGRGISPSRFLHSFSEVTSNQQGLEGQRGDPCARSACRHAGGRAARGVSHP